MALSFESILMDGIGDRVFVVRVEQGDTFIYDFLNRAAIKETGFDQHVIGQSIQSVHNEEEALFLQEQLKKVLSSGEKVTYVSSHESNTGELAYTSTTLSLLSKDQSQCQYIVAIVSDITKKKQAQLEAREALDDLIESNKKFQSIFHHNPDAIFVLDLEGHITNGNKAIKLVTGYTPTELSGSTLGSLAISESVHRLDQYFEQAVNEPTDIFQITIHHKTGNHVHVSIKFTPVIVDGDVIGIYGILQDITELVISQRKLRESEQEFRIIAENASDLVTMFDKEGTIIYASPSYRSILGIDQEEYIGKFFTHNVHLEDRAQISEAILTSIEHGEPFTVQFKQFDAHGKSIWSESKGTPVFDDDDQFEHMVVLTRDITLQKEEEMRLTYFAFHDSLTGLPNRRFFKERLEERLLEFQTSQEKLAVIMLDIDHFKGINDEMGHDVGDEAIEELGKRLSSVVRDSDTVARLGGDEFVILLPHIQSVEQAVAVMEAIQDKVSEPWTLTDGDPLEITVSMGLAMVPDEGATAPSMLKAADVALYEAKKAGRDGFKVKSGI